MRENDGRLEGLLLVDKPGSEEAEVQPGERLPTSHDIVQRVRRLSGLKRIGHTGTLDPMASGLLLLCLGKATRLAEYYQGHAKRYQARIVFGRETDTYDALGETLREEPVPELSDSSIHHALQRFEGEIEQRPPLFSAIKQGGESLYRKARRGEQVTVQARRVTIHRIELVSWTPPNQADVDLTCSAGTYVRSLAKDLGDVLNVPAHLGALRRTEIGPFQVSDAHTLQSLEEAAEKGRLSDLLLPVGTGLRMPVLDVDESSALRLSQGQRIRRRFTVKDQADNRPGLRLRCVGENDQFLGVLELLEFDGQSGLFKVDKWLGQP